MLDFTRTQITNSEGHSIKTSYTITGSEQTDDQGHVTVAVLEVTTQHHQGRKAFFSWVSRTRSEKGVTVTTQTPVPRFTTQTPVSKFTTHVPYYKEEHMRAAHEAYLVYAGPEMTASLDWAAAI